MADSNVPMAVGDTIHLFSNSQDVAKIATDTYVTLCGARPAAQECRPERGEPMCGLCIDAENAQPTPELGTVSEGTMLASDLIPAFLDALDTYAPAVAASLRAEYTATLEMDADDLDGEEDAQFLVEALFDALNAIAPDGAHFGSHPGDGSDYGFWTLEDERATDSGPRATCVECGRVFDLALESDAAEWSYGHDCE